METLEKLIGTKAINQLTELVQLNKKFNNGGLSESEYERHEKLIEMLAKKMPFIK